MTLPKGAGIQLYIANKNYSSWSLRAWLLMRQMQIAFEEVSLRLDFDAASPFKQALARVAPSGKVPVLIDDGFAVWDTLAIAEYLAEKFPALWLWPGDRLARARARSLCAEMHGGFVALRNACPMNIEASLPHIGPRLLGELPALAADLARIVSMWQGALAGSGGPWLFGPFGMADAYFAPVCSRITTYGLPVPAEIAAYVERVLGLPAMQEWSTAARAEHDFIVEDELYRTQT